MTEQELHQNATAVATVAGGASATYSIPVIDTGASWTTRNSLRSYPADYDAVDMRNTSATFNNDLRVWNDFENGPGGWNALLNDSSGTNGTITTSANDSEYDYDYDMALQTFNWHELAPSLVIFTVTYIIGVVGNALILFTIARYRRLKTTTNVFLASLSSADLLLILICIPVKLARLFSYSWTLGEIMCKSLYYLQAISAICSVLTLTIISLERYYAIVYPMRAQYRCTISQAKRLCAGVWLLSCILAAPVLYMQIHMEVGERVRAYWCVRNFDAPFLWRAYQTYMMILVLVFPVIVMANAYTVIGVSIVRMVEKRRSITGKGQMGNGVLLLNNMTRERHRETDHAEVRQVVSMLVVVVFLFVLCWSPIMIINVLKAYGVLSVYSITLKHFVTVADLLSYCNSCVNPIVYGFMSKNFRESFRQVLFCSRKLHRVNMQRQMSLSLTRTSVLRYSTDSSRVWNCRQMSSRVSYPMNYGCNFSRNDTVVMKTTPS